MATKTGTASPIARELGMRSYRLPRSGAVTGEVTPSTLGGMPVEIYTVELVQ
ncbi:hypothetical protein ABH922_001247 [Rhodococcus sp. 27YEA15]